MNLLQYCLFTTVPINYFEISLIAKIYNKKPKTYVCDSVKQQMRTLNYLLDTTILRHQGFSTMICEAYSIAFGILFSRTSPISIYSSVLLIETLNALQRRFF